MRVPAAPVRIVAAAALLVAALVGVVVREAVARAGGEEIRVRIDGYDPRELLTGHYVQFQIQETRNGPCPPGARTLEFPPRRRGDWIALRREGDRDIAVGAFTERRAAEAVGERVLRGGLSCTPDFTPLANGADSAENARRIQMVIGIDRIHLAQAEAEAMAVELNRGGPARGALAILSVDPTGKARLKGVVVGGRRVDLEVF